jgi:hypothetical protein
MAAVFLAQVIARGSQASYSLASTIRPSGTARSTVEEAGLRCEGPPGLPLVRCVNDAGLVLESCFSIALPSSIRKSDRRVLPTESGLPLCASLALFG